MVDSRLTQARDGVILRNSCSSEIHTEFYGTECDGSKPQAVQQQMRDTWTDRQVDRQTDKIGGWMDGWI